MRLRPGSDQIAYGLIYRAVFFSRRDDPRGIKSDSIFIISSVAYPKILCIPAIERPGSPTRHKAISSYLTLDISYSVILPDTQRRRTPPVATEKKPAQIGHLAAEKRRQFRVRARALEKGSGPGADQVANGISWRLHGLASTIDK